MMKRKSTSGLVISVTISSMLFACIWAIIPFFLNAETGSFDYKNYQRFLEKYVAEGRQIQGVTLNVVDYDAIYSDRNNPGSLYIKVLRQLKDFNPEALINRDDKIAFWINAYNIGAIKMIIDHYPIDSIRSAKIHWLKNPWNKKILRIGNKDFSLGHIEHKILLGEHRELLIHYAIVCASVSCPEIIPEVYEGPKLQEQLERQARNFLGNGKKGIRIIRDQGLVFFSKIFKFDRENFPNGAKDAISIIAPFIENREDTEYLRNGDYDIKYLDYNWSLNRLKKE